MTSRAMQQQLDKAETRVRLELSVSTVAVIIAALEGRRAAEMNNLALGPGSQRIINAINRADAEVREQLPAQIGEFA